MANQLWLLSPERADQCSGLLQPNTCYKVLDLGTIESTFVDFILPEFHDGACCEMLDDPKHLRNGGRWLLLEQLPN